MDGEPSFKHVARRELILERCQDRAQGGVAYLFYRVAYSHPFTTSNSPFRPIPEFLVYQHRVGADPNICGCAISSYLTLTIRSERKSLDQANDTGLLKGLACCRCVRQHPLFDVTLRQNPSPLPARCDKQDLKAVVGGSTVGNRC
jgi:hypothetical protein